MCCRSALRRHGRCVAVASLLLPPVAARCHVRSISSTTCVGETWKPSLSTTVGDYLRLQLRPLVDAVVTEVLHRGCARGRGQRARQRCLSLSASASLLAACVPRGSSCTHKSRPKSSQGQLRCVQRRTGGNGCPARARGGWMTLSRVS